LARLLAVSDLHFPEYQRELHRLTSILGSTSIDALLLAGDFLSSPLENRVRSLLRVIRGAYKGPIIAVWGNHEHYLTRNRLRKGWTSLDQLGLLKTILEEYNVHILDDTGPERIKDVSLAGTVGWYDYSYGPPGYTREDYERCNPYGVPLGVIEACEHRHWNPLCPPRWRNDCIYIRLPIPNEEYARLNAENLRRQLAEAEPPVIAVLHHAPRRELLRYTGRSVEDFDLAYAGFPMLGDAIDEYRDKTITTIYGHLHTRSKSRATRINGVTYINAYYTAPGPQGFVLIDTAIEEGGYKVKHQVIP